MSFQKHFSSRGVGLPWAIANDVSVNRMLAVKMFQKKGNRMPNLFMVMLGGRHARANTEVHGMLYL